MGYQRAVNALLITLNVVPSEESMTNQDATTQPKDAKTTEKLVSIANPRRTRLGTKR